MTRSRRLFAAAVLPALLVAASHAAASHVTVDERSQRRVGVRTEPVSRMTFASRLPVTGDVVRSPGTSATLRTIVGGHVVALHVLPGERVTEGQPLMRVHSHEVQQLEARLLTAREAWQMADSRLRAGEELLALEGIPAIEVERRRHAALRARLEFETVRHELEDLGYTEHEIEAAFARGRPEGFLEIRSPVDGVALALHVAENEWFQAFDPLAEVGDPSDVELRLALTPSDAALVAPGNRVTFSAVGHPELGGEARVVTRIPEVDPETRTVAVRARIVGTRPALPPGVFVQGELTWGTPRSSCAVPESAVIRIAGRDHVFVRRGPDRFEAVPVRLGELVDGTYEVLEGLAEGDRVVVSGVFLLKSALLAAGD
ncbi:MAG: efflux RND transporter periplasmic adaptor subunit [Acidobacteria bacterium]|nr:MAG: efflux RND transporter periplasmic adaptor subunit [Acidobacteriota bacterium]